MEWKQIPLGPIQTNAYVITNDNNEAIIIDPGEEGDRLISMIESQEATPLAVLLTHAHFDHIGAVDAVRDNWSIPAYIHHNEKDWLNDPDKNGSSFFPMIERDIRTRDADHIIEGEGKLHIGGFSFEIFETPGHSPGSVSFYDQKNSIVFSGDALFAGSIGRTDLPGGDQDELIDSIEAKLLTLPEETVVAPGHGPETTIDAERDSNPFL